MTTKPEMKDLLAQCNAGNAGELMNKYKIKWDGKNYSIKGTLFACLEDAASYIIENGLVIENTQSSNTTSRSGKTQSQSSFSLSRFIVSSHGLLTEISLWLGMLLFVILGWNINASMNYDKNGIAGAIVGLILWFIIAVFFIAPALMLGDIRKSVKRIEEKK